jgi:hypothetical protein
MQPYPSKFNRGGDGLFEMCGLSQNPFSVLETNTRVDEKTRAAVWLFYHTMRG